MPDGDSSLKRLVLLVDRDSHQPVTQWLPTDAQLTHWVEAALAESTPIAINELQGSDAGAVSIEISLSCVSGVKMREMNSQYRDKDSLTNVLSFPADMPILPLEGETNESSLVLGDIIICPEVLDKEAQEQGKLIEHHWAHMVVHSVLHLNGLDHEEENAAKLMESLEIEILSKLDIANPYIANSAKQS